MHGEQNKKVPLTMVTKERSRTKRIPFIRENLFADHGYAAGWRLTASAGDAQPVMLSFNRKSSLLGVD